MNPAYDECPKYCVIYPEREDCSTFCAVCDKGVAKNEFEEATKDLLDQRMKNLWTVYKLDSLIDDVSNVFELKNSPTDISVTAKVLIGIIDYEIYRQKRIHDWNLRQERKRREIENGN